MILKKLNIAVIGLAILLSVFVTTSQAQRGRYWRGDNGNHYGWYNNRRYRNRGRVVTYSRWNSPYNRYRTTRYYSNYYRRPSYYGYRRSYYPRRYVYYNQYPRYRTYRVRNW